MGSDSLCSGQSISKCVSIHAPTWGATGAGLSTLGNLAGFNPRSHMGSDRRLISYYHISDVSIHAPTWGATFWSSSLLPDSGVSIHAPTWGATKGAGDSHWEFRFQSTLPHGERQLSSLVCITNCGFQSTLPHGERQS